MYGLIDCNNFFVSCERVFDQRLNGKKVVVLSNNDGCVIARSNEAKAAGIPMGCPAFKIKEHTDPRDIIQLSARHGNNIVKAKWQPKSEIAFLSELKITALDTAGLLNRMTDVLSNEMKLNLHALHMEAKNDLVEATLSLYVHNTKELDDLIVKLNRMKDVQKVVRKNTSDGK